MKKYRNRLEFLLRLKKHREKECQREHVEAMRLVHKQKDQISELDLKRSLATHSQRTQAECSTLTMSKLLCAARYVSKLKTERMALTEICRGLERQAEVKRVKLLLAARERQIQEKLKERSYARYLKEIGLLEQKEMDEIASVSYARR